jgi:hypothetical protein
MLLQRACAALDIPLAIGAACDERNFVHITAPRYVATPVSWLQRFESDPRSAGPRAMIAGLYGHGGKEALSRSLSIARAALLPRPEEVKLVLYIHDGQPDEPRAVICRTIEEMRRAGLIVIGLYLGDQSGLASLQEIFGPAWTIGVGDLRALPARLGRLLARFRRGAAQ